MSKLVHGLLHVGAIALQVGGIASSLIPAPYKPLYAAAIAVIQAVIALVNHGGGK